MLVGAGILRADTAGYELEHLDEAHYRAIHRAMERALADGALGISLGLGYAPECFYTTEELIRALEPLRGQDIPLTVHMRQEGAGVCGAVEEMLTVARTLRIPLHISHLKAMGRDNWGVKIPRALAMLEKARQELTRRGLLAQSECRLTNGLCGIAPVGVDVVVIAGMGGELIADILSRWDYTENPAITYLLQPMTRPVHLRRWLYTHRFTLREERCCRANGKLYTVLRAQYTGCATEETPAALYFGALDLENDPLAGEYREQVLGRLRRRITGLVEAKPGPERDAELAEATKLLLALR